MKISWIRNRSYKQTSQDEAMIRRAMDTHQCLNQIKTWAPQLMYINNGQGPIYPRLFLGARKKIITELTIRRENIIKYSLTESVSEKELYNSFKNRLNIVEQKLYRHGYRT